MNTTEFGDMFPFVFQQTRLNGYQNRSEKNRSSIYIPNFTEELIS